MAEPMTDAEINYARDWIVDRFSSERWLATVEARDAEIARLRAEVERLCNLCDGE